MADIKDTKEMVSLVASLAKAFKEAQSDGKVNIADLAQLMAVIPHVAPALEGVSTIPEELQDLDEAEVKELADKVKEIVGDLTSDDKYVDVADSAVKAGFEIYKIVQVLSGG